MWNQLRPALASEVYIDQISKHIKVNTLRKNRFSILATHCSYYHKNMWQIIIYTQTEENTLSYYWVTLVRPAWEANNCHHRRWRSQGKGQQGDIWSRGNREGLAVLSEVVSQNDLGMDSSTLNWRQLQAWQLSPLLSDNLRPLGLTWCLWRWQFWKTDLLCAHGAMAGSGSHWLHF